MSGALCENIYSLIATRCVLGIAAAFVSVGMNALLGDYYLLGVSRIERALSMQGFVMSVGGAILTMLSGYLTNYAWQYAFLVYGSGIIVIFLCVMFLFEPRTKKAKEATAKDSMKNNAKNSYKAFFSCVFHRVFYNGSLLFSRNRISSLYRRCARLRIKVYRTCNGFANFEFWYFCFLL